METIDKFDLARIIEAAIIESGEGLTSSEIRDALDMVKKLYNPYNQ